MKILRVMLAFLFVICFSCFLGGAASADGEHGAAVRSGACSDTVNWAFYEDDTLIISGTGDMPEYTHTSEGNPPPWFPVSSDIKRVILEEGITSLSSWSLGYVNYFEELSLPSTLRTIGDFAVISNFRLTEITIPEGVESIGDTAFTYCYSLASVSLPSTLTEIGVQAFFYDPMLENINVAENNPVYCSNDGILYTKDPLTAVKCPDAKTGEYTVLEGTVEIASGAFLGSKLSMIRLPDSLNVIGDHAFQEAKLLEAVDMPRSLESLGESAFAYCFTLESIRVPDGVIAIRGSTFNECENLSSVTLPDTVTAVEAFAFSKCRSLWLDRLPPNLETIEMYAFDYCPIGDSIVIPKTVVSIEEGAFNKCGFCRYILEDGNVVFAADSEGVLYKGNTLALFPPGREGSYTVPEGVIALGYKAFIGCRIEEIHLPSSLQVILPFCFQDCEQLTNVTLPYGVSTIGKYAFGECSSLTRMVIPGSVRTVAEFLFCDCEALKEVVFEEGVLTLSPYLLNLSENLESVTIPASVTVIDENALSTSWPPFKDLHLIVSPASEGHRFAVSHGHPYVFAGQDGSGSCGASLSWTCDENQAVTIAGSGDMSDFDENAAPWGTWVRQAVFGDGITSVGSNAFRNCTLLTEITVPDEVVSIGSFAFFGCAGLKSVFIPSDVMTIGTEAFEGCPNLVITGYTDSAAETYALNHGIEFIPVHITVDGGVCGSGAQWMLDHLGVLTITGSGMIDSHPWNTQLVTQAVIEDGITGVGAHAFEGCSFLRFVSFADTVETVGDSAFRNCPLLRQILLPCALAEIGNNAFEDCVGLIGVLLPDSVSSVGGEAFAGCSGLKTALFMNANAVIGTDAFAYCPSLTVYGYEGSLAQQSAESAQVPFSAVSAVEGWGLCGETVQWWKDEEGRLTIAGVGRMADYVRWNEAPWGTEITEIRVLDGITHIGKNAFYGCDMMESAFLPEGLSSIGISAFRECHGLTRIALPTSLVSIGGGAFCDCGLEEITLPDALETIGERAFEGSFFPSVMIPAGVTGLGEGAFDYSAIKTISFTGTCIPEIGDRMFESSSLEIAAIPQGARRIGAYAFGYCYSLSEVTVPATVTEIDETAFYECYLFTLRVEPGSYALAYALEHNIKYELYCRFTDEEILSLPSGLKTIETQAFVGLDCARAVRIPAGVEFIAPNAFDLDTVLLVPAGSPWKQWAEDNGFACMEE
ncbi:MAG: leucine-rich repeat domain-containing protein [Clostridia bacterium]|nr:leucine-rich repeat domain-containing protein [Clostridia bacterium]